MAYPINYYINQNLGSISNPISKCVECSAIYVNGTRIPLRIRISEHLKRPTKSQFGHYIKFTIYYFSPSNDIKLPHAMPINFLKMNLLENVEISKQMNINLQHCQKTQTNLNYKFNALFRYFWEGADTDC